MLNPFFKSEDEHEQNEKSIDKDLNTLTSDIKSLRQLSKINNKDKHNLLKIVNMYMKDDKKAQTKMKISGIIKKSKKMKSKF
jgi:ribosomal protein S15P/S13E